MRRRELLTGAIVITGSTLIDKASQLRSVASEFKLAMTTLFWVGEPSNAENNFIPNHESYWDKDWLASYGGVDDPEHRDEYWPAGFRPKENPFYVALPYGELTDADRLKISARRIPWYRPGGERIVLFCAMAGRRTVRRGRLRLCLRRRNHTAEHLCTRAGLDVSPAVRSSQPFRGPVGRGISGLFRDYFEEAGREPENPRLRGCAGRL
jgi:hypothetical protein